MGKGERLKHIPRDRRCGARPPQPPAEQRQHHDGAHSMLGRNVARGTLAHHDADRREGSSAGRNPYHLVPVVQLGIPERDPMTVASPGEQRRRSARLSLVVLFSRYVALGDSFTEGIGDPHPRSRNGLRGWADLVAARLAGDNPDFRYANLAVRGRTMGDVLDGQLDAAIALEPDLVTIYAG